jgi:hypothetical protein
MFIPFSACYSYSPSLWVYYSTFYYFYGSSGEVCCWDDDLVLTPMIGNICGEHSYEHFLDLFPVEGFNLSFSSELLGS